VRVGKIELLAKVIISAAAFLFVVTLFLTMASVMSYLF